MRYKFTNGKTVQRGTAFTYNELQYPSNWLELSTDAEKQALGLTLIVETPRPDDRFYWVTDNGDGTYSKTPKDLEDGAEYVDLRGITRRPLGMKSQFIAQVKNTAGSILAQTDWMVIRKAERNVALPTAIANYRASIVSKADNLETAISSVTTVEELIALDLSFPSLEN